VSGLRNVTAEVAVGAVVFHEEEEESMHLATPRRPRVGGGWIRAVVSAGLVVLAGALAACGSSAGGSASDASTATRVAASGPAPRCGDGSGKPATGAPISVGGMETASNGADSSQGVRTAQAYFECLNANGGIGGRPLVYHTQDDALAPATAARGAAALVRDAGIVGDVGASYLECPVAGPIYARAGVYEVEAAGGSAQCFTSPNIGSVAQGAPLAASAVVDDLIRRGARRIAVLDPDIPGLGDAAQQAAQRTAAAGGARIVKTVFYKPGVQDATSIMLAAAGANPDGMALVGIKADLVILLKAAQQQNLRDRFKWAAVNQIYSPEVPQELGAYWANGSLHVPHEYSPFGASTTDARLWSGVMAHYAPGVPTDELSEGSFVAAKLLADTLATIRGPITAGSVAAALSKVRGYTTDMLCNPWSWGSLPFRVSNTYDRVAAIEGGAWKDVTGCTAISDPALKR
jgi:branched-chain amino acid transport system substrate-binding protein